MSERLIINNESEKDIENKIEINNKIKQNVDNIISDFLEVYLNKFDEFSDKMQLAQLVLEIYYEKISNVSKKLNIVDSHFKDKLESQEKFFVEFNKLNKVDSKLSKLEINTKMLISRIADFQKKLNDIGYADKFSLNYNEEDK